jgi:hypothetical protein
MANTNNINSKYTSWSLIDPLPIVFFNNEVQEFLVAWNGIQLIPEHALIVATNYYWKVLPTPEMKRTADEKFKKLYYLGAFSESGNLGWDQIIQERSTDYSMTSFYTYYLNPHLYKKLSHIEAPEVFNWFSKLYKTED